MKITCLVLCFLGLAAFVSADSGFFVPKAFYKLDAEGHKSNVHEINPHQANILRRLRRQTFGSSSSSSTSSFTTGDGGQTYYESHQVVKNSAPGILQSRFSGDDDDDDFGITGHAVHTTGVIKNGRVVYEDVRHEKL
ncbi:uncharacterized protein LOC129918544 isoform X2 [Episyrphus balteatus]|uniref:uncharacterized protein LOC129918544 isoform X2 n=1 Tax=Episyrphus balteatus TaxID=286459 RepID=UPI0024862E8D|nr:uncharacterized protein LOC129918544 isoform X2 [Episyrphus balteatus]